LIRFENIFQYTVVQKISAIFVKISAQDFEDIAML